MSLCSTLHKSFLFLLLTSLLYHLLVPERHADQLLLDDVFIVHTMDNPMIDWFKDCVQKLYQQDPAQGEKEQSSLLESIFDKNVNLLHNHKPMSLSEYMNNLSQSSFATAKTDLEWNVILSQEDEGEAQVWTKSSSLRFRLDPYQSRVVSWLGILLSLDI